MSVLCYVRPWSVQQFTGIASRLAGGGSVKLCADFAGLGDVHLEERFIGYLEEAAENVSPDDIAGLSAEQLEDVRVRCRLLRSLQIPQAYRLMASMWRALTEVIEEIEPDLVLSKAIDSYVLDLLHLAARRRDVPYLGLISLFVNDHYRITSRGEHNAVREPSLREVDEVLDRLLLDEYRPQYLVVLPSSREVFRRSVRNQARNLARYLYYAGRRRLGRDPFCYHDWSSEVLSRERVAGAIQRLPGRADWRQAMNTSPASKVFVPLQFFPEATVDYWCPNVEFIDYYSVLDRTLECLQGCGAQIVLKEHPGALGLRPGGFYERLSRYGNVIFVPTAVHSNELVRACDAVVVWTGTVGFEAALRGKSVLHYGKPFYASGRRFWHPEALDALPEVLESMLGTEIGPIDRDEQRLLVAHVLKGCLSGALFDSDADADVDGSGAANLDRIAAALAAVDASALP